MCGICGIVRRDQEPVNRELLNRMNDRIIHRGPDGEGFYTAPGVGLAMRRLAIIDLVTGDQPIPNEDQTVWIIFNGEIYNFPVLRNMLEKLGHQFRTKTDTECIIHLYEEYGENCIDHLRGQFAFAIWDQLEQCLYIGRDRFGQKPLYYSIQNGHLYFSSELESLIIGIPSRPQINFQTIDLYLSLQYIPDPYTAFEGVYKLPAAHKLIFNRENFRIEPYWHLEYEPKLHESKTELGSELRELLSEAVRIRMISDVPLGAHLSGGIDSSIVVALMAEASDRPVKTFSVGFEESAFSELPYAREVADIYGTEHHEFKLTLGDIPKILEKLVTHFGEPFADPSAIPLFYLSKLTREHVTVVLNGDGGDEAFAGYQRYWLDPWANRYNLLPKWIRMNMIPQITRWFPDKDVQPIGRSLVNGLKRLEQISQIDSRASILRWGSYFSPEWKLALWSESVIDQSVSFHVHAFDRAIANNFMDQTLSTDIQTYLPGDLLVKADRMTMANSLEGRSPFLDHKLAEWAARLPPNMKVRGFTGKYLLRETFKNELPPSIYKRTKQGFGIPLGSWFRGQLMSWTEDILLRENTPICSWFNPSTIRLILEEHINGRVNHGKRIYALVMLSLWSQMVTNN